MWLEKKNASCILRLHISYSTIKQAYIPVNKRNAFSQSINAHVHFELKCFAVLEVNYGISNTIVLEIP